MKIVLSEQNYNFNKPEIEKCSISDMCKIMAVTRPGSDTEYFICADVSAGWTFPSGRRFHGTDHDGPDSFREALGTFYLISDTPADDGIHVLEFTDDLNPDMP